MGLLCYSILIPLQCGFCFDAGPSSSFGRLCLSLNAIVDVFFVLDIIFHAKYFVFEKSGLLIKDPQRRLSWPKLAEHPFILPAGESNCIDLNNQLPVSSLCALCILYYIYHG